VGVVGDAKEKNNMTRFTGVWPALVTPLTEDDHINVAVTRQLVEALIAAGVGGLYVCGSTGEGVLLPAAERKHMAETVIEQANGRVPVAVHAGALTTADTVDLAIHAEKVGADGVSAVPPFYYKVDLQGIKEHYESIARSCSLPLYLYYIPSTTDVTLTARQLWELCQIPNVKGYKHSSSDLYLLQQVLSLSGGTLNVLSGPDGLFLSCLTMGVDGAIGSTYNLLPRHFIKLSEAFHDGDIETARTLQRQANRVIHALHRHDWLPALKEAMRLIGFDCGYCRRPLRRLSETEAIALRTDLDEAGLWDLLE